MPENFAHAGRNGTYGRSDTDWGEAGALTASAYITKHFGDVYLDIPRKQAFGINGCRVIKLNETAKTVKLTIKEELGYSHEIVIQTNTGERFTRSLMANETGVYEIDL